MVDNVSVNWWGVLVATIIVTVLAGLYFTVVIGKAYNAAVGRAADAPPGAGPLFIVGPLVCNVASIIASAVLISALEIDTLGDGLVFGAIVGVATWLRWSSRSRSTRSSPALRPSQKERTDLLDGQDGATSVGAVAYVASGILPRRHVALCPRTDAR